MPAARSKMSPEEIAVDMETNKKRMKTAKEKRSQIQIDANGEKQRESRAAERMKRIQQYEKYITIYASKRA